MIEDIASVYSPRFPKTVAYMLQASEYDFEAYLKWFWSTDNFKTVIRRRDFVFTKRSKIILRILQLGMGAQSLLGAVVFVWGLASGHAGLTVTGSFLFLISPVFWAHFILVPLVIARHLLAKPLDAKNVQKSKETFATHRAVKIAVAGSYGKTSMKEMLLTVLSEGKKVAATPANKNVASEHAKFSKRLKGDEDVLIIEFGEGAPGDVPKFANTTKPDMGVITGLAPAHLDKYKTLEAAGRDIFSLADYVKTSDLFVNAEPVAVKPFLKSGLSLYSSGQAAGWKISNLKTSIGGISFDLKKGSKSMKLKSGLLGAHQVGPLAVVAVIADRLGLSKSQIEQGIAKIEPFEHRMQLRQAAGAWIIDDTYNGNIEGMKAGLELLKSLKAKRKIYVTPGLVDQGQEAETIHKQLGHYIAAAGPDLVILMKHTVTPWIEKGLKAAKYKGRLTIQDDPLHFYNNLDQFIAAGDLVLMQNDWPDNYK